MRLRTTPSPDGMTSLQMSAVTAGVEEAGLDGFEESCLLMRTSRRRSLALILLYSLYSSRCGTRSSFCTFLQGGEREGGVTARHQQISCVCSKAVSLSVNQLSPDSITLRADYMIADNVEGQLPGPLLHLPPEGGVGGVWLLVFDPSDEVTRSTAMMTSDSASPPAALPLLFLVLLVFLLLLLLLPLHLFSPSFLFFLPLVLLLLFDLLPEVSRLPLDDGLQGLSAPLTGGGHLGGGGAFRMSGVLQVGRAAPRSAAGFLKHRLLTGQLLLVAVTVLLTVSAAHLDVVGPAVILPLPFDALLNELQRFLSGGMLIFDLCVVSALVQRGAEALG
ncbi:hypothetical protein F7725_010495 [Dissostichus mawsoni]|uniref:Uncharacterized protein n=1 Tax=Dissostichus mawsoni TaxID=36200 RepID=A0A7J5XQ57_DISMA|nr:hypothetical protein F7725_010495 [Dissostichus mawsoni]